MIKWFRSRAGEDRPGLLFPQGYTDIHNHLLPGLDDGAPDVETALALLDKMVGLGIRHFVCTPHVMEGMWRNTTADIRQTLEDFRPRVEARFGPTITLDAAAEYMIDEGLEDRISNRDILPLRDNLVLVEMSFVAPPIHLFSTLAELQIAGYRPVLAHPERYFFYHGDLEAYHQLKEAGCLFQLNLLSMGNYYGKDVRKTAQRLLAAGMYDLTGSDLHHDRHFAALKKLIQSRDFHRNIGDLLQRQIFPEFWKAESIDKE